MNSNEIRRNDYRHVENSRVTTATAECGGADSRNMERPRGEETRGKWEKNVYPEKPELRPNGIRITNTRLGFKK